MNRLNYKICDEGMYATCPEYFNIIKRELNTEDYIFIVGGKDVSGKWLHEIYDEVEIGLPKREPQKFIEKRNDRLSLDSVSWWNISINESPAILFQETDRSLVIAIGRREFNKN